MLGEVRGATGDGCGDMTVEDTPASARSELRVTFHEQLDALKGDVQQVFALVGEAVGRGTEAFLSGDLLAAVA